MKNGIPMRCLLACTLYRESAVWSLNASLHQTEYTQKTYIILINSDLSEEFMTLRLYFYKSGHSFICFINSYSTYIIRKIEDLLLYTWPLNLNVEMKNRIDI